METIVKNKFTEKYLKLLPWIFVGSGAVLIFSKISLWPSWYTPRFYGIAFMASALIFVLSGKIFKAETESQKSAATFLRLAVGVMLTFNYLGELGLYRLYLYGIQYDKMAHFVSPFLFFTALVFYLEARYNFSRKKALFRAALSVAFLGLLWEGIEFSSDTLFKTTELGVYGMFAASDTLFDFVSDLLGIGAAWVMLVNSPAAKKYYIKRKIIELGSENFPLRNISRDSGYLK